MIASPLVLVFAVLVLLWAVKRWRWQRKLWACGIPGPTPSLLFGHMQVIEDRKKMYETLIPKYGRIFSMFANGPRVVVADPELVRLIQVKDFQIFSDREKLFPIGGFDANAKYDVSVAVGSLSNQRWKEQRALITTGFTSSKIKTSVPLVSDGIDGLLENIQLREKDADFNIHDLFQRLTMDTIGRSAFGVHLDVQRNPGNEFFVATKTVFQSFAKSWYSILTFVSVLFPEFFYFLYPIRVMQRLFFTWIGKPSHFEVQLNMCVQIVEQRKRMKKNGDYVPDDFLQRLIDATLTNEEMDRVNENNLAADQVLDSENQEGKEVTSHKSKVHRMSDEEVAANASVMFDAGYETTSTLLAFLFHILVNRQDIQDEIRREVLELLEKDGELNYNVMHSLPYMESVIYETMRLYPPVTGFVTRQPVTDYQYKNITIPAGTIVEIAVDYLQTDADLWHDPLTFDALRFYGANKSRIQSAGYQAFGAGPRNCLGMRFALMEAKLVVAKLLSQYKVIPGPRTEPFHSIEIEHKPVTQNPKNGVFVKAVRI